MDNCKAEIDLGKANFLNWILWSNVLECCRVSKRKIVCKSFLSSIFMMMIIYTSKFLIIKINRLKKEQLFSSSFFFFCFLIFQYIYHYLKIYKGIIIQIMISTVYLYDIDGTVEVLCPNLRIFIIVIGNLFMEREKINFNFEGSESSTEHTFFLRRLSSGPTSPFVEVDFSPVLKPSPT